MDLICRQASEKDFKECENITREAFWDVYKPGCDEHLVLTKIRKSNCYVRELDLLAIEDEIIIGHIICTKAKVIDARNNEYGVLCVGPFSIMNNQQRKGYGSKLMEYCIFKAKEMGYAAMILFGNPNYYNRFGFRNAGEYGITTKEGMNFDPFMAKELQKDGLKEIQGKFYEDESYFVDAAELNKFEEQFPYKEKHITDTQLKFQNEE